MIEEWLVVEIDSVCNEIVDCLNRTAPKVDYETPYKMIRTSNVRHGRIDLENVFYVNEATYNKWTRRLVPKKGDIILTREAPLGEIGILKTDDKVFLGQRTVMYRTNEKVCNSQFLYYSLLAPYCQSNISAFGSGSTVEHMRVPDSKKIKLRLPPLQIQLKIGSILSAYDDLIENNLKRIKLLEEQAQQTYEEWFVRMKFPGYETAVFDEESGLPVGWEIKPFSELAQINPKTTIKKGTIAPYVPMSSVSENSMIISPIEERAASGGTKFKNGDTIFARITPCLENGKTGFVQFMDSDDQVSTGSTEYIVFRESEYIGKYFIYCTARTHEFRENAIKSMVGSDGRQRVKVECFEKSLINYPGKKKVKVFEKNFDSVFKLIQNFQKQNQLLKEARDILLPRLMSGMIDPSTISGQFVEVDTQVNYRS